MAEKLEEFTRRFRDLVIQHGGANKVAEITGLSKTTINYYVQGSRFPDAGNLLRLSETLNVSADYLLGRTEDDNFSADEKIRLVTEFTGLSSLSVQYLHAHQEINKPENPAPEILGNQTDRVINFINRILRMSDPFTGYSTAHHLFDSLEQYIAGPEVEDENVMFEGYKAYKPSVIKAILLDQITFDLDHLRRIDKMELESIEMAKLAEETEGDDSGADNSNIENADQKD